MNIFFLDKHLDKCAEYHVDKHVIKIILESAQVLSTAYPKDNSPYKHTHVNHPIAVWVRSSLSNFNWTLDYCFALCKEYTYRYGKIHKTESIAKWMRDNPPSLVDIGPTEPPRCFGGMNILVTDNVVEDYRNYYKSGKAHLFEWKNRPKPNWV